MNTRNSQNRFFAIFAILEKKEVFIIEELFILTLTFIHNRWWCDHAGPPLSNAVAVRLMGGPRRSGNADINPWVLV